MELRKLPRQLIDLERRLIADAVRTTLNITGIVVGVPAIAVPALSSLLARLDPGTPAVQAHRFLTPEWIEAARAIRAELESKATTTPPSFRMNQVVTDVPFGDGTINAHTDTTSGELVMDLGHLENPDVTVTLPYGVARKLLVEQDQQAAMQAFMTGQIKVEGDIAKLMAMQTQTVDPVALEAAVRIKAITLSGDDE
jgi:hypothetical protein